MLRNLAAMEISEKVLLHHIAWPGPNNPGNTPRQSASRMGDTPVGALPRSQ